MVDSNPVFPYSKSSSSIPRLAWGVIVQGFIRIVRMALEIPVVSKLGTPRYFSPKTHVIGSHNLWLIMSMVLLQKLCRRTMEPCTTTKTTTIIGWQFASEQYQLETNG